MPETWPTDIIAREAEFWLQSNTATFESPLTRKRQTLVRAGRRWMCRLELFVHRDKARRVDAFLARLRGAAGTVLLWDQDRPLPAETIRLHADWVAGQDYPEPFSDGTFFDDGMGFAVEGRPLALTAAAARGDTELFLDGWQPGVTALSEGDYIGIGGYLHLVVATGMADDNGMFSVTVEPPLRAALTTAAAVTVERPTAPFHLLTDDHARNPSDADHMYRYSLEFVEAL